MSTAARFDEIVHAPNRLQVCAILSAVSSADFATVREALGVADSVLSKHVRVLHDAGVHRRAQVHLRIAGADQPVPDRGRAGSV